MKKSSSAPCLTQINTVSVASPRRLSIVSTKALPINIVESANIEAIIQTPISSIVQCKITFPDDIREQAVCLATPSDPPSAPMSVFTKIPVEEELDRFNRLLIRIRQARGLRRGDSKQPRSNER